MPEGFVANIDAKVYARDWETFYEYDSREDPRRDGHARGIRENLLVSAPGGWAVVRYDHGVYIVVSVLTEEQYRFNSTALWSRTKVRALEKAGGGPQTLRHNPFAEKLK